MKNGGKPYYELDALARVYKKKFISLVKNKK